ncbi:AAA family ATPase, partial [Aequorivita soesokkakensis]|uniref:AAA family ATPase n=1 Tax=Aequorivita soesokkakensis TaxID=1385699 RepID=UPI0013F4EA46
MEIKRLKIEKLYGYIDKDIKFNPDLTLLVGINGAGKTSILNVINWIVRPSLPYLCVTEFKSITLWFSSNNKEYEVNCKHNKTTFHYKLKSDEKVFNPLIVQLKHHPKNIQNDETLRNNLIEGYKRLSPDEKEKETWELIATLPSPTIIGLDRNLYTEESEDSIYFDEGAKIMLKRKKSESLKSPVDRVKEIINVEYRKRKNKVLNLTNTLKNHLMISAFDGSITLEGLASGTRYKLNISQIEKAESRVKEYFQNFEKDTLTEKEKNTITSYFKELKNITLKYTEDQKNDNVKLLYALNAHQFIKIRNLLKEFEKFEAQSIKTMSEVQTYLDTLNYFFKDSAKEILFKEDTSEITFNNLDKNGKPITKYK